MEALLSIRRDYCSQKINNQLNHRALDYLSLYSEITLSTNRISIRVDPSFLEQQP